MMKKILSAVCLSVCVLAAQSNPNAPNALPNELEKDILNELRQIHLLLERQQPQAQPAPAAPALETAKVSTAGYALGSKNAPLTLVEFADYQCPFCRQFHSTVFAQLKKDYIDTGKLLFISRDLPLEIHPNALGAAQAARCAGEQNKFWQMRDTLIAHADNLATDAVGTYANQVGLDMERFHSCVQKETYLASIRQDVADASSAGISGTPSFVIGRTSGAEIEGLKVIGAQPYESFEKILSRYPPEPQPKTDTPVK